MRTNPYTALQRAARDWARKVVYPTRRSMWQYPKDKLGAGWSLADLKERVAAADTLGWDVRLRVNDAGDLAVEYVQRAGEPPWGIRP